jgi:hypothetical protein
MITTHTIVNVNAENIGVDAGLIIVGCTSYLKHVPSPSMKALKKLGKVFKVQPGKYNVSWRIPDSWNGEIKGNNETLEIKEDLFVVDPCYVIGTRSNEDWSKWLEDTDYGNKIDSEKAFVISSMGDGCYEVELRLEKIS